MNNPVQIRRNWTPSHPRACLPVTFRRSLSSSPTASSESSLSEHGGTRDSNASSGEIDDEACSEGMPPSPLSLSSPVQPPVIALSATEQHMRDKEPFSLATLASAQAQLAPTDMDSASRLSAVEPSAKDPNAASLPGEENLQGSVSLLDWGSLVLSSLTDIRMASPSAHSFNSATTDWSPLLPSLLPLATPPSGPTFVASTSAHPQEDTGDNFFVQFGQEMVHYLAAKYGFTQHVILKSAKSWACGTSLSIITTQQAAFGKNGAQTHGTGKIKLCQTVSPNSNGSTDQLIWCQPVNQPPEPMSRSRVHATIAGITGQMVYPLKIELSRHGQGHGQTT
ncbi:hypothetical protein B0H16DRAFT_1476564 [Mycena metata]|uniref:Uncharacterized protein n=1 Tax=Mycena metata TaxID=1033252 RepID=A0AAD7HB62_9AGAR|nr:hypothetical protein B0H16DRAFT_1476564 [Mycena metata]